MANFSIDYGKLENKLLKKAYRLSDVKDRLEVLCFDVVRFRDGDEASKLWQIQSAEDGEYIVTLYEEESAPKIANWDVVLSKTAGIVNFYYKGDPIVKVAVNRLGIPKEEISSIKSYLPTKLTENKKLVHALLSELSEPAKNAVFNKYPELV